MSTVRPSLGLPGAARADFAAAQSAYQEWRNNCDDFFHEEAAAASMTLFREHITAVVDISLRAGIDREALRAAIVGAFPDAQYAVESVISATPEPILDSAPLLVDEIDTVEVPAGWDRSCPVCGATTALAADFCSRCGSKLGEPTLSELLPLLMQMRAEIDSLRKSGDSTSLPSTALLSRDFLTRAFAVYGHAFVASLLIFLPVYVIVLLFGLGG